MAGKATAIGISVGMTNSCVGVWENDYVEIIPSNLGNRTTPSYVAFTDLQRLIGDAAKDQANTNPKNTVYGAKRLIGRRFTDPSVKLNMNHFPFKIIPGRGDKPRIVVKYKSEEKQISAEEISAILLIKMRDISEAYIGSKIKDAVLTVPACFNAAQRQATKEAATIAGLNVLRLINEPTAAAIAYGFKKKPVGEKDIVIFHLGGGSFDVSVVSFDMGRFKVKASSGYTDLGGVDFNNRMVNYFVEEFKRERNKNIGKDPRAIRRLWNECENVKKILTTTTYATIKIEALLEGDIDFCSGISRQKFEEINMDLFSKCMETVEKCLTDSGVDKDSIYEVVLSGGSTRIPKVKQLLQEFFKEKTLYQGINEEEIVSFGAAVQAAVLSGVKNENLTDMLKFDITALPLGYERTVGGVNVLIPRNTILPTSESLSINSNNHLSGVVIQVYQGETTETKDAFLGKFELSHLTDISFGLDIDGILKLSVGNNITGGKNEKIIGMLSTQEIEKMVKETERFRDDDKNYKERVDAKNALQKYAYNKSEIAKNWKIIFEAAENVIQWSESKQLAELQEFEKKIKELETLCNRYNCH